MRGPRRFPEGLGYVAVSRVPNMSKLVLMSLSRSAMAPPTAALEEMRRLRKFTAKWIDERIDQSLIAMYLRPLLEDVPVLTDPIDEETCPKEAEQSSRKRKKEGSTTVPPQLVQPTMHAVLGGKASFFEK